MSAGDITRRDSILWGFTPADCKPYWKYQQRQLLFREAVIGLLVGETKEEKKTRQEREYCEACRATKRNKDCETCPKTFGVNEHG